MIFKLLRSVEISVASSEAAGEPAARQVLRVYVAVGRPEGFEEGRVGSNVALLSVRVSFLGCFAHRFRLGIAVGKEKFLNDAREAIGAMMNTQVEADDVQREQGPWASGHRLLA